MASHKMPIPLSTLWLFLRLNKQNSFEEIFFMRKLTIFLCPAFPAYLHSFSLPVNDNSCSAVSIYESFQNLDVWYKFIVPANGFAVTGLEKIIPEAAG
jgi:hypothetical protein